MEERNLLFVTLIVTEILGAVCFAKSPSYRSSDSERIINVEVRVDTVQHDVANLRQDVIKIWNYFSWLNTSLIDREISSQSTGKHITDASLQNEEVRRLFSAFKDEKYAVHNILREVSKNASELQKQILGDIGTISEHHEKTETVYVKNEYKIMELDQNLQILDKNIKSLISGQEKRIETLEKDVKKYKKIIEDNDKELEELKSKISHLEVFTEKMFRNLSISCTPCPPTWHQYMGSCYFFSTITSNWTEAEKKCEQERAYLVEYNSLDEVRFVLDLVLSTEPAWSQSTFAGFWAGASDINKEGDWMWSGSGKKVGSGFTNWEKHQPDNYKGKEDCLMSCINLEGKWNDGWCPSKQKYVCEKDFFSF